ncbi:MAG: histidine--tRNA ligase [bacterium]
MASFQSPRGTRDILPIDQAVWRHVRETAERVAYSMGYQPITLPTYEELGLFQRAIGEGTDVQDKEMFLVSGKQADAGDARYALRPEGTAGMVRSFIENGMHTWPQPVRLFSIVNLFRYERPQKGRYREHVQFDFEYFGDKSPFADAWVIYTGWRFLRELGLEGLELRINNLGTSVEREAYLREFVAFCQPFKERLSEDSRRRLEINPLRILDSKDPEDKRLCLEAPQLTDFLTQESHAHADTVMSYLAEWGIPTFNDSFLIRGLDYYSQTAFEWTVKTSTGQQDSLGGGGRYDGLVIQLGGSDVGAIGTGIGLDRVVEEVIRQQKDVGIIAFTPTVYVVAADDQGADYARAAIVPRLLDSGIALECNLAKTGVSAQMKSANRSGALFAIIVGTTEADAQTVELKDLSSGSQETVSLEDLPGRLAHA